MKILTRDDTNHNTEYVTLTDYRLLEMDLQVTEAECRIRMEVQSRLEKEKYDSDCDLHWMKVGVNDIRRKAECAHGVRDATGELLEMAKSLLSNAVVTDGRKIGEENQTGRE
jgi:hypothetical protein